MTLVDSNILLDLLTYDPVWAEWSLAALDAAAIGGPLLINDIIYAEISSRFDSVEPLDIFVDETNLRIEPISRAALFLAAKAHSRYRAAGGVKTGVLSDFLIGAHAAVLNIPVLTRDIARYKTYFPTVILLSPKVS